MLTGMPIELPSESVPWHEAFPTVEFTRAVRHGRGPAPYGYAYAGEDEEGCTYREIARPCAWEPTQASESSEPGRYFVSVRRDDGAFRNVSGYYVWQSDALRALPGVKAEWMKLDPHACWYAWGTAREV